MPHKFKDAAGRDWVISLNLSVAKKLKDDLGLDLVDDQKALDKLLRDSYLLANTLYVLCETQAKAANVSDYEFGEGLAGDSLDNATNALLEAMVDFFPSSRREALRKALATMKDAQDKATALAIRKLSSDQTTAMVDRELKTLEGKIDDLLAGKQSGSAPEQSAGVGTT